MDKEKIKIRIRQRTRQAIKDGELVRPDACELCDIVPKPITHRLRNGNVLELSGLIAHHWNGYNEGGALSVWFICRSCNSRMMGDEWHSGQITKEEARKYIADFSYHTSTLVVETICKFRGCNKLAETQNDYCCHHAYWLGKPPLKKSKWEQILERGWIEVDGRYRVGCPECSKQYKANQYKALARHEDECWYF